MADKRPACNEKAMPSPKRPSTDDGIDVGNIITGKRRRRPTTRLVDSTEWQHDYQQLILEDVPENEITAALLDDQLDDEALYSDDEEEEEEEEDGSSGDEDDVADFIVDDSETEGSDDDDFIDVGSSDSESEDE